MLRSTGKNPRKGRVPDRLECSIICLTLLESHKTLAMVRLGVLDLLDFHLQVVQIFSGSCKPGIHVYKIRRISR